MGEPRMRWLAKKAMRHAVGVAGVCSGSLLLRKALRRQPIVRAITYHRFGDAERDPWCVRETMFEQQMRWLAATGRAVSLDDVVAFCRGERDLHDGSVLVTMDDGFASTATFAAPLLHSLGIPSVSFVTTASVGAAYPGMERFVTWDELRGLPALGMQIGSHGHTHRSMASLPEDELRGDARTSKQLLDAHLPAPVSAYAYPFGMRKDENETTARVLNECGFATVFISQHGLIRRGSNRLRIPRIKIEAGEPLWHFRALCGGAMDVWSCVESI